MTDAARHTPQAEGDMGFRSFYEEAFPRVYGYMLRRVGNREVAADLAQVTFTAALTEIRAGHVEAVSLPYLYGIARHKLVDHFRQCARERRRLARLLTRTRPAVDGDGGPGPDPGIIDLPDDPAWQALNHVAPNQRAALVLHYVDDLPVADVAACLGRSVHATESLLARGRDAFRAAYREPADV